MLVQPDLICIFSILNLHSLLKPCQSDRGVAGSILGSGKFDSGFQFHSELFFYELCQLIELWLGLRLTRERIGSLHWLRFVSQTIMMRQRNVMYPSMLPCIIVYISLKLITTTNAIYSAFVLCAIQIFTYYTGWIVWCLNCYYIL